MILGMSLSSFTILHTVISLIGIAAGIIAIVGLLGGRMLGGWTALFLTTTLLTCITGFMFPFNTLLPSHIVGVITLAALAVAFFALYSKHLTGAWRWTYVASAVLSLYLNSFVGVVQAFQKLPFLQPLAPTQSEPPFLIAQTILLVVVIAVGIVAARKFRPQVAMA